MLNNATATGAPKVDGRGSHDKHRTSVVECEEFVIGHIQF